MMGSDERFRGLIPVLTAAEVREWEKQCFDPASRPAPASPESSHPALSERVVMESAGRAAALAIAREFPVGVVVAAVGKGNNGGDAVVALRTLRAWGREVIAVPVG